MKTLLYATDRTKYSVPALRYAYNLSSKLGAGLVVFYIHSEPHIRVPVSRPHKQVEHHVIEEQIEILKTYCITYLGETVKDGNIQFEVAHDASISHAIIEKSKKLSADMILIGRKDKHTERGLLVGDIGKALLGKVPCPLLFIPNTIENLETDTILYATAFEEADIDGINKLLPMARIFDARIHVVHVSTEKEYARKEQMEWFRELLAQNVDFENIEFKLLISDRIEEKLKTYSELIRAGLVVLLEREEKGFFQKLFSKSLVQKMESHIEIPLLCFFRKHI